jgi:hypothetical protein
MPTLNYTTKIEPGQSVAEMTALLVKAGADAIATRYTGGQPSGLSFTLPTAFGIRSFALPCNVDGMRSALLREENRGEFRALRKASGTFSTQEHAARVAWRVLKDWLAAQLALINAGQATVDQVMLPYLLVSEDGNRTLYQAYSENQLQALEAGGTS